MKKIYNLIATFILASTLMAQAPEKMSYQAVVRDASNALAANQSVGMRVSILQGTVSGPSIYVETQNPTSNANGLVTLEIGTGSVVLGSFANVNWGAGPYFIKTETDPTGGTNYTITGTSQLMSVPYALHAKAADSLVGLSSSDLNYLLGLIPPQPQIGDYLHGGVVFWIDPNDPYHGLVCAIDDQGSGVEWGCQGTILPGVFGTQIGDGALNTSNIVAGCSTPGIAAKLIHNVSINGYSDWYLPSLLELSEVYANKAAINATSLANGGTAMGSNIYWTSSQSSSIANVASIVNFSNGVLGSFNKGFSLSMRVRAIRAF